MNDKDSFSAEQAAAANTVLRTALGLPPQRFSSEQFVGMISEEVEQLRAAGRSDHDISGLLRESGIAIEPDTIARYYADETERIGYP